MGSDATIYLYPSRLEDSRALRGYAATRENPTGIGKDKVTKTLMLSTVPRNSAPPQVAARLKYPESPDGGL